MIIQTLVENAIKHSINNLPGGGKIIIETKTLQSIAVIYVKIQVSLNSKMHKREKA